jgi:hypothetical protein
MRGVKLVVPAGEDIRQRGPEERQVSGRGAGKLRKFLRREAQILQYLQVSDGEFGFSVAALHSCASFLSKR